MIEIGKIKIGDRLPFVLIAGPCVVENETLTLKTAEEIKKITDELKIPYIFKSSYKKANRTSIKSFSGLDLNDAVKILNKVKESFDLPILTDVHTEQEIEVANEIADVIQIPAFLCRQTELLIAAGKTGKVVNVKKGQFLAPEDMKHVAEKIETTGNKKILLTERGTTFGYHNLVVDMRGLEIMKSFGYPVVMDATHAVQIPGQGDISGGERKFISTLAKAAAAVGINGLFLEVHPEPDKALSDAASQLPLSSLRQLLITIQEIDSIVKNEK
ncbi:MAG: 3-deoxy-8-phosphooctulonate synthase [Melioribacteraceae bacterium]|jgi:2-dehydro-3-deoxyphosphooctonate aldolase (KDO 8-P synthase)|nr:3-deoxy-8-phosphooctulonate synthase [Melioribacteraceae bacterium]